MLFRIILGYLTFCCCLFVLYELVKDIFADRILANGWAETNEYEEYEDEKGESYDPYFDLEYYLDFFIPGINIFIFIDLIELILHTPEEMGVK